jgi:hypothetical protein
MGLDGFESQISQTSSQFFPIPSNPCVLGITEQAPTGYLPTPARASHLPPPARNRVIPRRGTQPHATHGVRSDGWNASEEPHAAMEQRAGRSPLPPFFFPLSSLSKKQLPNRVHISRCPVTSDHRCLYIYIAPLSHWSPSIAFARTHGSHSISAACL